MGGHGGCRDRGSRPLHGGTRLFSPPEVADVSAKLAAFDEDELRRRYETLDFSGAYGSELDGRPSREPDDYLHAFHHLREFYGAAAQAGDAMMVWLG